MKSSTLNFVTSLNNKLMEFPGLVNSLENKEIFFIDKLILWTKHTEDIFINHNVSLVSELSGLRSKIVSQKFSGNRGTTVRALQLKVASEVLYDLQHTVLKVLTPLEQKLEECRELIRQLLLMVSQTHAIKYNPGSSYDKLVIDVWLFILSHEQLKAGAIKLKTILKVNDIYILIAEEINLEDFQ